MMSMAKTKALCFNRKSMSNARCESLAETKPLNLLARLEILQLI